MDAHELQTELTGEEIKLVRKYESFLTNTGGNDPVELLHRKGVSLFNNSPVALLKTSTMAQVDLLKMFQEAGIISSDPEYKAGTFRGDLERVINCHNKESGSDTPDFILASYLIDCLKAFDAATSAREEWYGRVSKAVPPPEGG